MNSRIYIGLCAVLALGALGYSKPKNKDDFPKALLVARYAYVEALDGDIYSLNLIPEDREAIVNVENALRGWKHYDVTMRRSDAEILFVVRKERIASVKVGGTISHGPIPGTSDPDTRVGTQLGAEVGPNEDMLYVYLINPDGKKMGPIWKEYLKDGLDRPEMPLFQKFKGQVDAASKAAAAAAAAKQNNGKP
ncbi:MAG TPA: hypothetical protein VGJ06_18900 [Candidatus Acidoferrum sp.]|jgi:hypothetical protein